jgi:hypothetical protein
MCNAVPIAGNVSRAIEFSTKTVPSETAISSWLALVIGAIAAMALPPQMAVPHDEIRDSLLHLQESSQPPAQEQGDADAARGIDEPRASSLHNLLQIHTKPKSDDGCLKEEFR